VKLTATRAIVDLTGYTRQFFEHTLNIRTHIVSYRITFVLQIMKTNQLYLLFKAWHRHTESHNPNQSINQRVIAFSGDQF